MNKFTPEHYPPEYTEGFSLSDREAVDRALQYWSTSDLEVVAIVVEETDRGTVVHAQTGDTLHEINWSEPGKMPNEMKGYAQTVYMLAGPHEQQLKRAQMLSEAIGAPEGVVAYEDASADYLVVQLMGHGQAFLIKDRLINESSKSRT